MLRPRDFLLMLLLFAAAFAALLIPGGFDDRFGSVPPHADIADADPDTDITGVVVDTRGRPVAGAYVTSDYRIWGRARIPGPDWTRAEVDGPETITARDGTFRLTIGHGEIVDLCIRPQEQGEAKACWRRPGDHVRVVVTEGAELIVDVADANGEPIPDARVFVLGVLPFRAPMHFHSGVTDAGGRYSYPQLSAGTVELRVFSDGRRMEEPVRTAIPPSGTASAAVRMVPGNAEPNAKLPTAPARSGRVTDESNEPIEGARVVYGNLRTRTDANGEFEFGPRPAAPGPLLVWAPGVGRAILRSHLPDVRGAAFRLTPGITIEGIVDPKLVGAVVEMGSGPSTEEIAVVDSRGTFRFADVGMGTWRVTVLHPDADSITREIRVEPVRAPERLDLRTTK